MAYETKFTNITPVSVMIGGVWQLYDGALSRIGVDKNSLYSYEIVLEALQREDSKVEAWSLDEPEGAE